jgi:hypothetical protein
MRPLQQLWFALALSAFAALTLAPSLAAADTPTGPNDPLYYGPGSSQTTSMPPSQTTGFPPSQTTGLPPSQTTGFPPSQTTGMPPSQTVGGIQNPLSGSGINGICGLLKALVNVMILFGVPIAMLFVVFAGFKLVFARGRPDELKKARLNLVYVLAGIAIVVGVWAVVTVLANTLGALGVQVLGDCR